MSRRDRIKVIVTGTLAGCAFAFVTAWLFYDLEPVSLSLFLVTPFFIRLFWKKKTEQRMQTLDIQFKDALLIFRNGLDAGYSPEHSLKDAAKGLESLYGKNAEITKGFNEMAGKLSTGMAMEQAFAEFADASGVKRIRDFSDLFRILKRTGGNLNKVIRSTVSNLTDSINLRRDLNVVIAAKKGEFNVMSAIPYGILLYLKTLAPEMSGPLYHSTFGIAFMTGVLIFCFLCYLFGQSVIGRTLKV